LQLRLYRGWEGNTCAVPWEPVLSKLPIKRLKRTTWIKGRAGSPLTKDTSHIGPGYQTGAAKNPIGQASPQENAGRIVPIQTTGECCCSESGKRLERFN
jgi:hypothetical protein